MNKRKKKEHHQQQVSARMWGRKEPSYTAGGNVSLYNHSGKQYRSFLKN
jgi:hypothetical protein